MTLSAHLKLAIQKGFLLGIVLGHIDLAVRISTLKFEWFEIYLALLSPALVCVVLCVICSLLHHLIAMQLKKEISVTKIEVAFNSLIFTIALIVVVGVLLHITIYGPFYMFEILSLEELGPLFLANLIFCLIAAQALKYLLRAKLKWWKTSYLKKIADHYIFLVVFFILSSFVIDLASLISNPTLSPENTSAKNKPNLIWIVLDTVRADHLSPYGYTKNTSPNLEDLAKKSVLFENATSSSPWTLPSHSTMFTGKYPFRHGANFANQQLSKEHVTLAEILKEQGYLTAGFVGAAYCKAKYGIGQGFMTYHDRLDFFEYKHTQEWFGIQKFIAFFSIKLKNFIFNTDGEQTAPEINKKVISWLEKNGESPFFLFINYFDAHDPYILGEEYHNLFLKEERDYKSIDSMLQTYSNDNEHIYANIEVAEDLRQYMMGIYDREIYYLDRHLGLLLKALEKTKNWKNTVLIITADHGEEFFDHGGVLHSNTLYNELLHVPLIIYYPSKFEPKRVVNRVGNIDFFATVLDILDIRNVNTFDSLSLLPLLKGEKAFQRPPILSERYQRNPSIDSRQKALTSQDWKLIDVKPERERIPNSLFNIKEDPREKNNLYLKEEELRNTMYNAMKESLGDDTK